MLDPSCILALTTIAWALATSPDVPAPTSADPDPVPVSNIGNEQHFGAQANVLATTRPASAEHSQFMAIEPPLAPSATAQAQAPDVAWRFASCTEAHQRSIETAVDEVNGQLGPGHHLVLQVEIAGDDGQQTRWRVRWQLGPASDSFEFSANDCESLAAATVERLHSSFPAPLWTTSEGQGRGENFAGTANDVELRPPPASAPTIAVPRDPKVVRAEKKARRRADRRVRFRTPQPTAIVPPRAGTLSVRGGIMSDFWRPWGQVNVGLDLHFPRNIAVEIVGLLNYTRHDLTNDPVQDVRVGAVTRACNLRLIGQRVELAICIGLDILFRTNTHYLADAKTRIDQLTAFELAFSNRNALTWWLAKAFGLSLNIEFAGRFYEQRIQSSTRLRTPRPFRATIGIGMEFALPRSRL